MEKKRIEDMFSINMDAYLNGIKRLDKTKSEEYNELLELGMTLADKDFSRDSNRQKVFNKTMKNINKYKGDDIVKKSKKTLVTKVASFALVCVLGVSVMQTSFAQGVVDKIVRTVSLGHITVFEEEPSEIKSYPIPDELKGEIFDKDGNPLEVFSEDGPKKIYTIDGEEIADLDFESGKIITVAEEEKMMEDLTLVVKDPNELSNYTCFDVKLPSYLPEGFKFSKAEFFKEDKDDVVENSKYIGLYFTNEKTGKHIYMQQRLAEKEAAYATGADKVEEIKINGADAIFYGGTNLDWEANGVIYMLSGRGLVTKGEMIKMAESIK